MKNVLSMEPWSFNKHILVLRALASNEQPSMMKFDRALWWIRLYDILMMGREEGYLKQIGRKVGSFLEFDITTTTGLA